jgi:type II secretory pathway pseudopilin PulG
MKRPPRPEAGLTLIELLVSVVILGFIGSVLATALFIGIRTTTQNQTSLDQSNSEQLLANYLVRDVAAACSPTIVGGPTCTRNPNPSITAGTACGTAVVFAMDILTNATGTSADTTVGYALQSNQLRRVSCPLGSSSASSSVTIARTITSITPSAPTTGACANQFKVDVTAAGTTTGATYAPYPYVLCAHRRTG